MASVNRVVAHLCVGVTLLLHVSAMYKVQEKTQGVPWPMPQSMQQSNTTYFLDGERFRFVPTGALTESCDLLQQGFLRYYRMLFDDVYWETLKQRSQLGKMAFPQEYSPVQQLSVAVNGTCEKMPYLDMDESYVLKVMTPTSELTSKTIWGALRGLETFSQLIYENDQDWLVLNKTSITDSPRFSHRGAMVDSSRHFLPKASLLQFLDAMSYNKLNVFHWHIVDEETFPYESIKFPQMSDKGTYGPTHVYTQGDIREIIEYARVRGIRVMAEFDTPGHTHSWGNGMPNLLTPCYSGGKPDGTVGPINPILNSTYTFLRALMEEVTQVFPDNYVHVGGDEVKFTCWKSNPDVVAFMKQMGFGTDFAKLENYYEQKLLDILNSLNHDYMVWQEIIDNGLKVRPDTVVEVWKDQKDMTLTTSKGFRTILASCWYLNYISFGKDWVKYYNCEPLNFNGTAEQKELVIGGELCMWGEFVDGTNLISRSWPRGAAPAERLWSAESMKYSGETAARLEEHRCRMIRRGLRMEPVNGPGFCKHEYRGV